MAAAVDAFLADPPPIRATPLRSKIPFQAEILRVYEVAAIRTGVR
jgi:hypothetical protein